MRAILAPNNSSSAEIDMRANILLAVVACLVSVYASNADSIICQYSLDILQSASESRTKVTYSWEEGVPDQFLLNNLNETASVQLANATSCRKKLTDGRESLRRIRIFTSSKRTTSCIGEEDQACTPTSRRERVRARNWYVRDMPFLS